jgi:hypothetical protein
MIAKNILRSVKTRRRREDLSAEKALLAIRGESKGSAMSRIRVVCLNGARMLRREWSSLADAGREPTEAHSGDTAKPLTGLPWYPVSRLTALNAYAIKIAYAST